MKQEEKDLLLKDLCARLSYGVKMNHVADDKHQPAILIGVAKDMITLQSSSGYTTADVEDYKPYLFPLSSMTEEQLFKVQSILGTNEIKIEDGFLRIVDSDRNTISYLEILALLEWFYKNHFDIKGLIDKGLAIDCTNLNIY